MCYTLFEITVNHKGLWWRKWSSPKSMIMWGCKLYCVWTMGKLAKNLYIYSLQMNSLQALSTSSYLMELNIQSIYFSDSIWASSPVAWEIHKHFLKNNKEWTFWSEKSIKVYLKDIYLRKNKRNQIESTQLSRNIPIVYRI